MKKSLLLFAAASALALPVMAEITAPVIYPEASFQRISADGKIIVSEVYGTMKIYNLETGKVTEFVQDEDAIYSYCVGEGNCITADGSILVGTTKSHSDAAYLYNGEWKQLSVPSEEMTNLSNGITPDGSRICGSIGLNEMTFEEVTMQVPAYWDRNADGSGYGEYHILPYPEKDLFGETPQYVTAVAISDDGKVIVGQMVFSSGGMTIPVVYTQDDKGEWSYSLPTKDLFNPDKIEPVENPGDGPEAPNYEDYMTEEEIAAYNKATEDYWNGESTVYPDFTEYMSAEKLAEYKAAQEAYDVTYAEWADKFDAYYEYTFAVMENSPNFLFNNIWVSADGTKIYSTTEAEDPNADPWSWFRSSIYTPCTIDIAAGTLDKVDTELSLLVSGVAGDVILAYNGQNSVPMLGYVIKDGEVQNLIDYLNAISPEYGEWITKNMSHEVVVDYDPETWEEIFEEVTFTGMPIATPDMSVIAFWNNAPWDDMEFAEGVVVDLKDSSAIRTISVADSALKVVAPGVVYVPEGFASVNVYNLNGACVKSLNTPAGAVRLNVAAGAYIVKGVRADGSLSVVKMVARGL